MTDVSAIQDTLRRMAALITIGGPLDWAKALDGFADRIVKDQDATISDILSTFGGMGSLNDIVLYSDHQPLVKENTELNALRRRLYTLCHE